MRLIRNDTFFNDPWTDLDRLFESTFPELYQWSPLRGADRPRSLPLDVYENENERIVRLEIPGVPKKDIHLELENAVLAVHAKREEKGDDGSRSIDLQRSVTVGDDIDADKVKAELENGILTVVLPKKENARPKQITVG